MDEKKRINDIKDGLKKSVYEQAAKINIEHSDDTESTERLSNILEGYVERIDTIEAQNMEEFEEELRVLKKSNVEVGESETHDDLVQQYNDYIHNDLDRTIAETVEYTYNLNNKTDDLNDILLRPMENEVVDDLEVGTSNESANIPEIAPDTDELFEIEATTDLGVLDDIVELEQDTLEIEETVDMNEDQGEEAVEATAQNKKAKKVKKAKVEKQEKSDDFTDEKGLAAFDYVLIVALIIIFIVLISLVAKINGVF